jgi:hypothetical protein
VQNIACRVSNRTFVGHPSTGRSRLAPLTCDLTRYTLGRNEDYMALNIEITGDVIRDLEIGKFLHSRALRFGSRCIEIYLSAYL